MCVAGGVLPAANQRGPSVSPMCAVSVRLKRAPSSRRAGARLGRMPGARVLSARAACAPKVWAPNATRACPECAPGVRAQRQKDNEEPQNSAPNADCRSGHKDRRRRAQGGEGGASGPAGVAGQPAGLPMGGGEADDAASCAGLCPQPPLAGAGPERKSRGRLAHGAKSGPRGRHSPVAPPMVRHRNGALHLMTMAVG